MRLLTAIERVRDYIALPRQGLSRQSLTVAAVAVLVVSAGCTGGLTGGDSGVEDAPAEFVPEGVDTVAAVDEGFISNEATATLYEGLVGLADDDFDDDAPTTWEEVLDEFDDETDLDLDGFDSAVLFAESSEVAEDAAGTGTVDSDVDTDEYAGVVIESNWEWEELRDAITDAESEAGVDDIDVEFEEDTYNGVTVYRAVDDEETGLIADIGDGTFVIGTTEAVEDSIDVQQGDASEFGGELRDAYDGAGDGLMKIAVAPETDVDVTESTFGVQQPEVFTMVYDTDGTQMSVDMQLTMPTTESAQQLEEGVSFFITGITSEAPEDDPLAELAEGLSVEQSGADATLSYEIDAEELIDLFEELSEQQGALVSESDETSASDTPA